MHWGCFYKRFVSECGGLMFYSKLIEGRANSFEARLIASAGYFLYKCV